MVAERELVGLLYRADWTKLALSGTVTGTEPVVDTVITVHSDEPLSGPWREKDDGRGRASGSSWSFEPGGEGAACTLSVVPGQRFRAEGADGAWALGCDGARMWHWFRDRPAGSFGLTELDGRPRPPYPILLVPSWLLTGYSLVLDSEVTRTIVSDGVRQWQVYSNRVLTGPASPPTSDLANLVDASWLLDRDLDLSGGTEVSVHGRRAYRIVARYRDKADNQDGARLGLGLWQRLFFPAVAVVDAETGLVLRLTRFKGGRPTMRQELRDVASPAPGTDFEFTPPPGLPVENAGSSRDESEPGTWSWSWNPPSY